MTALELHIVLRFSEVLSVTSGDLQSGVRFNVIALYLGHETPAATHRYVEANLAMKEQALARLEEPPTVVPRYRPPDELRQFLEDL